jgi:putative membrane protein
MTLFFTLASAGSDWDGGWHWFPFALLWVGLAVLVTWLILRRRGPSGLDRARDILAERYARGDLTSDEYRERLDRLGSA